jgi:hypothetical protein
LNAVVICFNNVKVLPDRMVSHVRLTTFRLWVVVAAAVPVVARVRTTVPTASTCARRDRMWPWARSEAALIEVDQLGSSLGRYYLFHATRAELLQRTGRTGDARQANQWPLRYTTNVAERAMLTGRLQR